MKIDCRKLPPTPSPPILYPYRDGLYDKIYSISQLEEAYNEGCLLLRHIVDRCILPQTGFDSITDFVGDACLCARIASVLPHETSTEAVISYYLLFYEQADCEPLFLEFGNDPEENYVLFAVDGTNFWSSHLAISLTFVGDPATANLNSRISYHDASLEQMRHFLRRCLDGEGEHEYCGSRRGHFVPGRLLHFKKSQDDTFQVTLTSPSTPTPYVALSYCWGGEQPHRLEKSRLSNYRENGIPWSTIPATIQDGIRTAEAFDYDAIWVDSLCIIQDDDKDMSNELAGMEEVYRSADFTIVAARSDAAKKGFRDVREEDFVCSLPFIAEDGTASWVYVLADPFNRDPGDRRAWMMQEAYLSRRLLRFGRLWTELSCHTFRDDGKIEILRISDGWNPSLYPTMGGPHLPPLSSLLELSELRLLTGVDDIPDTVAQATTAPFEWMLAVTEYTSRSLSFPSDRSVAIAGLAKFFAKSRDDNYIAGNWSRDLAKELCWQKKPRLDDPQPCEDDSQLPKACATSWSWTSVNTPVVFLHALGSQLNRHYKECIRVLEFRYQLKSPNMPYGAVNYAHLKIRGKLGRGLVAKDRRTLVIKTGSESFVDFDPVYISAEQWLTTPRSDTSAVSSSQLQTAALAWLDLKNEYSKLPDHFYTARPVDLLLAYQGTDRLHREVALFLLLSRSNVQAGDEAPTYWRGGSVIIAKGFDLRIEIEATDYDSIDRYFSQLEEEEFWLV